MTIDAAERSHHRRALRQTFTSPIDCIHPRRVEAMDAVDRLIEEVTVDAYGEYEQLWSFRQAFEDGARFPLSGRVVGVDLEITAVGFDGDERRGLVSVCRRGGERHTVSLLDVTPSGPLPMETRRLLDAYVAGPAPPRSARSNPRWLARGCIRGSRRSTSTSRRHWR